MDERTTPVLFALLRCAVCGQRISDTVRAQYAQEQLPDLIKEARKHDLLHLLALGLKRSGLIPGEYGELEKQMFKAAYRCERLNYECTQLWATLESAEIPFVPLKGAVLRQYYPEAWMRTSCDIDVLVHREDVEAAISCLVHSLRYVEKERGTHDVSLFSPRGDHIELHFDLVEEGRAKGAIGMLSSVWDNAVVHENSRYWYELSDEFFYFYHIAHMAKHLEEGGCGIRPFIDIWILDHIEGTDPGKREKLLEKSGLLPFAKAAQKLSRVWMNGEEADELALKLQNYILQGGAYGSADNRVALQQKKKGGRIGYLFSRMFIPYAKLKRYYPILGKHRWLFPVMQIRRWAMLFRPDVAKMARQELESNQKIDLAKADEMNAFLKHIGL